MKFKGKAWKFGADVDTDAIIPARYLNTSDPKELAKHCMEDSTNPDFMKKMQPGDIMVADKNFGCGSSREHAPWALEVNEITCVIAESYARIFRQNMFNGGMLAIELDRQAIDSLFELGKGASVSGTVDVDRKTLSFRTGKGKRLNVPFSLMEFDDTLVHAGGWVDFADKKY